MFINNFGEFNIGCFNSGWNNSFFPQPFSFTPTFPQIFNFTPQFFPNFSFFNFPMFNDNIWSTPPQNSFNISNTDSFVRTTSPLSNYNAAKGNILVNIANNRAVGNVGYCAKFVQEAISLAGMGECTGANANEMIGTLRANPNFKEISTKDIDVKTLPAGCILVYDKFVRNGTEPFGHVEFSRGNGSGISDGVTASLHPNPSAIFIPV